MCFTSICIIFISFLCFKCVFCVEMKPFISIAQEQTNKSNRKYPTQSLVSDARNLFDEIYKSNITNGNRGEVDMVETSIRSEHSSNSIEKYLMDLLKDHINSNNSILKTNDTTFSIYLNYDDLLPILNDYMDNTNKNWTDMSSQGLTRHDSKYTDTIQENKNNSVSGTFPFLINPFTITGNGTQKVRLKEIISQHQSKASGNLSYESNNVSNAQANFSYQQPKYPPWNELSIEEKNYVLRETQGDPQAYSDWATSTLTIYYSLLLLVGIPGNGLSILIIVTNSYMRTPPNIFLLNIALADFVTLTIGKLACRQS